MKKNSITNKITPCCSLPFSVVYWWISNLTLNSEADRQFILSKISQNGTISIDGWKVLVNSGTLEADSSLTKAEFLAWFDCGRQPNCEQLKIIIESFKVGNYNPIDEYGVGWTEEIIFEAYEEKIIKKIKGYVGGLGDLPAELSQRIGKYYGNNILTISKNEAIDFRGTGEVSEIRNVLDFFVKGEDIFQEIETSPEFFRDNAIIDEGLNQYPAEGYANTGFYVNTVPPEFTKIKIVGNFSSGGGNSYCFGNRTTEVYDILEMGARPQTEIVFNLDRKYEYYLFSYIKPNFKIFAVKHIEPEKDAVLKYINLKNDSETKRIQFPKKLAKIDFKTLSILPVDKGVVINGSFIININDTILEKSGTLEVQGSSSAGYPKKNFTFKFFNNEDLTDDFKLKIGKWAFHSEFVFKANYTDATHSRNLISNYIWEQIVQSRKYYPKRENETEYSSANGVVKERFDSGALCHVDGFPVELHVNGVFYGLGSFNLGKKRENYDLNKDNQNHIQIQTENNTSLQNYVPLDWEIRNPKTPNASVLPKIQAWFDANNLPTGSEFKNAFSTNHDLRNTIDFYLFTEFIMANDMFNKNLIATTWNGVKWFFLPYDMDTAFGLTWQGFFIDAATYSIRQVPFWSKFYDNYSTKIKSRYLELKNEDIFTLRNVYKHFSEMAKIIGVEKYQEEFSKWTEIPSNNLNITNVYGPAACYTSVAQVMQWMAERLYWMNEQYS